MKKVLLDTDIGGDIDDALCLAYLLREPECELVGITTVCGEAEKRASVADALCRAAERRVPIIAGRDTPLQPIPVYPTPEGAGALRNWPHAEYARGDAVAFLYDAIRSAPHEVTLLGIGNMTNIALLFQQHADAVSLLAGLYVMNGYFGRAPLPDAYYNWNSWADPLASKIVFASRPARHRAVTLEITDALSLDASRAAALLPAETTLLRAVYDFGNAWLESAHRLTLHDPLAAVCLFHESVCAFERGTVTVETEDARTMGGTTFRPAADGNVEISRSVDAALFYRILADTLRN